MKYYYLAVCCLCVLVYESVGLELVEKSQSNYQIYSSPNATPEEKNAAEQLQLFIRKVSGAELMITSTYDENKPLILVGQSDYAAKLLELDSFKNLKNDEIILKHHGNQIILLGQHPRATLYAINEFIEVILGVRFFTPDETFIPIKNTIEIDQLDIRYAPQFAVREIAYDAVGDAVFACRLRSNGHYLDSPPEWGKNNKIPGFCHTFEYFMPVEKYYKIHPEWYSLINKQRVGGALSGQLCLTNQEMRTEFIENIKKTLYENSDVGMISISQNDNWTWCSCANCTAVDNKEKSKSGSLIQFVNGVASELQDEFPDVLFETLAYQQTRTPPATLRPAENVMIRLCAIEIDYSKPIDDTVNSAFANDLKKWSAVCSKLGIWIYSANFHNFLIPHPAFLTLKKNVEFFSNNKVIYCFDEGIHNCGSHDTIGDLVALRVYLTGKLLWNPKLDQNQIITEFVKHYYGNAAPHVMDYLKLQEKELARPDAQLKCYQLNVDNWLSPQTLIAGRKIISDAQRLVPVDSKYYARLEEIIISLDAAALSSSNMLYSNTGNNAKFLKENIGSAEKLFERIRDYTEEKNLYYALDTPALPVLDAQKNAIVKKHGEQKNIPQFCQNLPDEDWMEFEQNTFRWAEIVDDPAAADGKAAKVKNASWAPQCVLPRLPGKWKLYASIRAEGDSASGFFMTFYNEKQKKEEAKTVESVGSFNRGTYQWMEMKHFNNSDDGYVFMTAAGGVTLWLDRIILVRTSK